MAGVDTIPGIGVTVEFSLTGGAFRRIPYAGNYSTSGGDPNVIEGDTFDGSYKRTGGLRVPDVDIEFPSYVPNHQAWVELHKAVADNNKPVHYRITTVEEEFFTAEGAGNTVAIATTGVATFAGVAPNFLGDDYGPGMELTIGSTNYKIDSISDAGVVTIRPAPGSAVAATISYKIINPQLRRTFIATFRSHAHDNTESGGILSTTLALAMTGVPAQWIVV